MGHMVKINLGKNDKPVTMCFFHVAGPSIMHDGKILTALTNNSIEEEKLAIKAWMTSLFIRGVTPDELIPTEAEIDDYTHGVTQSE